MDVLSLASEKDWSHVADAVTRSILYASRDGGSTLVDWVRVREISGSFRSLALRAAGEQRDGTSWGM